MTSCFFFIFIRCMHQILLYPQKDLQTNVVLNLTKDNFFTLRQNGGYLNKVVCRDFCWESVLSCFSSQTWSSPRSLFLSLKTERILFLRFSNLAGVGTELLAFFFVSTLQWPILMSFFWSFSLSHGSARAGNNKVNGTKKEPDFIGSHGIAWNAFPLRITSSNTCNWI